MGSVDITLQSTVYEPPEDGFKKRPKHVGACVKRFNVNFSAFLSVYVVCIFFFYGAAATQRGSWPPHS